MTIRLYVEHVFIATPIDVGREEKSKENDMHNIWTITTGSKKEEEGEEKK